MSTPTQPVPGHVEAVRAEISGFVVAVERELDDLPADDVADLTGGLEADLTDAWAAEGTTPAQRFGSPAAYAAELRASAGLPARKPPPRRSFSPFERAERWRLGMLSEMQAKPWWPELAERAQELRPAWWALRGVLLAVAACLWLAFFLGTAMPWPAMGLVVVPLAVAAVALSMRRGAAGQQPTPRSHRLVTAWNLAALVVLVWFWLLVTSAGSNDAGGYQEQYPPPGLSLDGDAVSNVFPYDAHGRPLTGVRLYDQNGRPLVVGTDGRAMYDDSGTERDVQPDHVTQGPAQWNLYPLQERSVPTAGPPTPYSDAEPPYDRVAPLPSGR